MERDEEGHQLGAETEDWSGIKLWAEIELDIAVGPALGTGSGTELEPKGGYRGVELDLGGVGVGVGV